MEKKIKTIILYLLILSIGIIVWYTKDLLIGGIGQGLGNLLLPFDMIFVFLLLAILLIVVTLLLRDLRKK